MEEQQSRQSYIVDLDGTLFDQSHREHLIKGKDKRWDDYFAQCVNDKPIYPVITTVEILAKAGCNILFFTGRSEFVRHETTKQIMDHTSAFTKEHISSSLWMRPSTGSDKFTPDHELKARWFEQLPKSISLSVVGVFEDRQKVVDMWRSKNIQCFQVAPGDF